MKSSYKLPGVFWDHRPIPVSPVSVGYLLTDGTLAGRCISLAEIFSMESGDEIDRYLDRWKGQPVAYIVLESALLPNSKVACKFVVHRLLQAVDYACGYLHCTQARIVLSDPEDRRKLIW